MLLDTKRGDRGWECSSVVEYLPSVNEAKDSMSDTAKTIREKRKKEGIKGGRKEGGRKGRKEREGGMVGRKERWIEHENKIRLKTINSYVPNDWIIISPLIVKD